MVQDLPWKDVSYSDGQQIPCHSETWKLINMNHISSQLNSVCISYTMF